MEQDCLEISLRESFKKKVFQLNKGHVWWCLVI